MEISYGITLESSQLAGSYLSIESDLLQIEEHRHSYMSKV